MVRCHRTAILNGTVLSLTSFFNIVFEDKARVNAGANAGAVVPWPDAVDSRLFVVEQ